MRLARVLGISFLVVVGLLMVVVVAGLYRLATYGRPVELPSHSFLLIPVDSSLVDSAPVMDFGLPFLDPPTTHLFELRNALETAASDIRIRGIILKVGGLGLGWGLSQELREMFGAFKASGKQVVAYMESAEDKDYFVASVADRIYLAPEGSLLLNGLSIEAEFIRETLDKLGIETDYHHKGEYKSAVEMFTRDSMSDPAREALSSILDGLYTQMVEGIAQGRKLTAKEVETYIDDFSIYGPGVVEAGMVDGLLFFDEMVEGLKAPEEEEVHLTSISDYSRTLSRRLILGDAPRIAILYVDGEIRSGNSGHGGMLGGDVVGSETISDAAETILESDNIRATVVRINSPGGSPLASDVIWRSLSRIGEKMPLVISMSDVAASGGYWIATAGDTIVAEPGTITGSIGVFMGKMNLTGLLNKAGVRIETLSRGRYAEILSPFKKFDAEETKKVDGMLQDTYDSFVHKVAESRQMTPVEVDKVARGRVWTGAQALGHRLVDEMGGLGTAIALAKGKAKIPETETCELVTYPQDDSFVSTLLRQWAVESRTEWSPEMSRLFSRVARATAETGPQVMLPFSFRIR